LFCILGNDKDDHCKGYDNGNNGYFHFSYVLAVPPLVSHTFKGSHTTATPSIILTDAM
jgi:hypothetical protein